MPICDFGDTAVVPFPFVDRPVVRGRPVVAISNRQFNEQNGHTVFAMITTAKQSTWPTDIVIGDGPSAGLLHPSIVRWKVFTLPNTLISRKLGLLGSHDREALGAGLRRHFGP